MAAIVLFTSAEAKAVEVISVSTDGIYSQKAPQQIALTFDLFQKLMYKSMAEVVQDLKNMGCVIEASHEVRFASVPHGYITVDPTRKQFDGIGVGLVTFTTSDINVYRSWCAALKKADYEPAGNGVWCGDNGHKPCFGILKGPIEDENDEYNTVDGYTLYVQSFPMRYNEKTGTYE